MNKQKMLTLLNAGVANLGPWLAAVLVTSIATSLIQSQINLALLVLMDVPVSLSAWLETNIHDLLTFMPFFAVMAAGAFIGAFPVAAWLTTRWPAHRCLIYSAAGFCGLWVAFFTTNHLFPVATLITATRHLPGNLLVLSTGVLGGWVYCQLTPSHTMAAVLAKTGDLPILKTATLVLIPLAFIAGSFFTHRAMLPQQQTPWQDSDALDYRVEVVADGLKHPWGIAFLPDGRKLISELPGDVRVIDASGVLQEEPLSGVPEVLLLGQGGLLDIAISPDFSSDNYVFLTYACGTATASNTCLSRSELAGNALVNTTVLLQARPAKSTALQYGSRMLFLPDKTLLVSIGDRFDFREEAQSLQEHYGKLLRLTMDGVAPEDNPFQGEPEHYPEIYSYGHRNPQGLYYDEVTDTLYASEHGPFGGDEINIVTAGSNYGWPVATHGVHYAGDYVSPYDSVAFAESPIYHWTPSIAPSGITLYRGTDFPELAGDLLVSALGGMAVFRLQLEDDQVIESQRLFHKLRKRIRQVTVGPNGSLYLLTDHDPGQLLRIVPAEQ